MRVLLEAFFFSVLTLGAFAEALPLQTPLIGAFEPGVLSGLLIRAESSDALGVQFVCDAHGLCDPRAAYENLTELGPYAPDGSYARLRWLARPLHPEAFSARFTGDYRCLGQERFDFRAKGQGECRVWLNGTLLISGAAGNFDSTSTATVNDGKNALRVDYRCTQGSASLEIEARRAESGDNFLPLPQVALTHGQNVGLQADYFSDTNWRIPVLQTVSPALNFNWGTKRDFNPPPDAYPIITLEWSRITPESAVGKISLTGGTRNSYQVHILGHSAGSVPGSVTGDLNHLRFGGCSIQFNRTATGICAEQNKLEALAHAQANAAGQKDTGASLQAAGPAVVLSSSVSAALPLYFTASAGGNDTFSVSEIDSRLRVTRTRFSQSRLSCDGAFAGAPENMINVLMWSLQLHDGKLQLAPRFASDGIWGLASSLDIIAAYTADSRLGRDLLTSPALSTAGDSALLPYVLYRSALTQKPDNKWLRQVAEQLSHGGSEESADLILNLAPVNDENCIRSTLSDFYSTYLLRIGSLISSEPGIAVAAAIGSERSVAKRQAQTNVLCTMLDSLAGLTGSDAIPELLNSVEKTSRWIIPVRLKSAASNGTISCVSPLVNYLACEAVRECGDYKTAARIAEVSADLLNGNATSGAVNPQFYRADNGAGIGTRMHPDNALAGLTVLGEFAEMTSSGLRLGSLTDRDSILKNFDLAGKTYTIQIGSKGVRVERNANVLVASSAPVVFEHFTDSPDQAHFSTVCLRPCEIRFRKGLHLISAVMDNTVQLIGRDEALRCPPGHHDFRVTFSSGPP
jgi:hypothetical protein